MGILSDAPGGNLLDGSQDQDLMYCDLTRTQELPRDCSCTLNTGCTYLGWKSRPERSYEEP